MTIVNELCASGDVSEIKTWLETIGNILLEEQGLVLGTFMNSQTDNLVILSLWRSLQRQVPNLIIVHPHVTETMLRVAISHVLPNPKLGRLGQDALTK